MCHAIFITIWMMFSNILQLNKYSFKTTLYSWREVPDIFYK
jgi:hypothetical protein